MTVKTSRIDIGGSPTTPDGIIASTSTPALGQGVTFRDVDVDTGCLVYTDIAFYGFASGTNAGERSGIGMDVTFAQVEIKNNNTLIAYFTANGTNFQTRRIDNFRLNTTNFTADGTVNVQDTGAVLTNIGAAGTVTITLPSGPSEGQNFTIYRVDNQILRVQPTASESNAIIVAAGKQVDDNYIELGAVGSCIKLVCNTQGDWMAVYENGTITPE
tara:strand:+ start:115795 stop:116439 length:645 start_codon:yes stop_codon:yes gene_type:complete